MPKTALILGGTKGLGLSLAWRVFSRGVKPIIAGRSSRKDIHLPPIAEVLHLDLTDHNSAKNVAGFIYGNPVDYLFWNAGIFSRKSFLGLRPIEIENMVATHLIGPLPILKSIHNSALFAQKPYHLITIASTSSWKNRENESLYCMLKAAKAAFTRNFALELARDLPGSKATLVHPGGMKTGFFNGTGQDISNFMDPEKVSRIIWDEVCYQEELFKEVQIMRNDDGTPNVTYGPRLPEIPV